MQTNRPHTAPPAGMPWPRCRGVLAVLGLAVYALAFQGSRGLWGGNEGRYTAIALEMLRLKSVTRLQFNDHGAHYTKPPLTHAAIAFSIALLGKNEFAARLPNALSFFFTVLLVWQLGRLIGMRRPWMAGAVYATAAIPFAASNVITTDTILTLWLTMAGVGLVAAWQATRAPARCGYLLLFWGSLGLAFMTKGPPALLPLIPFVIFGATQAGFRTSRPSMFWPPSVALFLLVGLSWYGVVLHREPGLWDAWFHRELVGRVLGTAANHGAHWFAIFTIYVPVIVLGAAPWSAVLWQLGWPPARFFNTAYWRAKRADDACGWFLFLWAAIPVGLFCMFPSRQPLYLLPSFVPLAALIGRRLDRGAGLVGWKAWALAGWIVLLVAGRGMSGRVPYDKDARVLAKQILRHAGGPPEEVVFVDYLSPWYGIKLYLDVPVDAVHTSINGEGDSYGVRPRSLRDKLSRGETAGLFIVDAPHLENLISVLRMAGFRSAAKGQWGKLRFVRAERDAMPPESAGAGAIPTGESR